MFYPPELRRSRERNQFDPIREGERYGLSRELSLAIWKRVSEDATDTFGRRNEEQAREKFYELAVRIAARGGRLRPDPGRFTRVGVELSGEPMGTWVADQLMPRVPGRQTLAAVEAQRWAKKVGEMAGEPVELVARGADEEKEQRQPPGAGEVAQAMAALQAGSRQSGNVQPEPMLVGPSTKVGDWLTHGLSIGDAAKPATPERQSPVGKRTSLGFGLEPYLAPALKAVLQRIGPNHRLRQELIAATANPIRSIAGTAQWAAPLTSIPMTNGKALWQAGERHAATLYRRAVSSGAADQYDPAVESALQKRGTGQPLPTEIRREMELELGVSLVGVRIHTDAVAAQAARALGAEAFTLEEDIFFAEGTFAPDTPSGRKLLAHELTHVVQALRSDPGPTQDGLRLSQPDEPLEREAEVVAERIARVTGSPALVGAVSQDPITGRPRSAWDGGHGIGLFAPPGASAGGADGQSLDAKIHHDEVTGQLEISEPGKAFRIVIDKDAMLPGIYAPGSPMVEGGQDLHGVERVYPWNIKSAHRADPRGKEFPVVNQPSPEPPVQRKATDDAEPGTDASMVVAEATRGLGGALPHQAQIQTSFGRHDVSNIRAFQGSETRGAMQTLGARAFAYGDAVAFNGAPDLHTAAHEAAHVVQQRAGVSLADGIGATGDRYEQHADAVGDAVVSGKSAEPLLDGLAGSGGRAPAIQRKDGDKQSETLSLPKGTNLAIQPDGAVIASAEWLRADPGFRVAPDGTYFPSRSADILRSLKRAGFFSWMDDAKIPEYSQRVHLYGNLGKEPYLRFQPAADLYAMIGPPPGSSVFVFRSGKGLEAIIRTTEMTTTTFTANTRLPLSSPVRNKMWTAVEDYTGLKLDPKIKNGLVNDTEPYQPEAAPKNEGIEVPLREETLSNLYGKKVWTDYLAKPQPQNTGGTVSSGGVKFSTDIPVAEQNYFLDWMKQITPGSDAPTKDTTAITPSLIQALHDIDNHPQKDKIIEQLKAKGTGGTPQELDTGFLRNVINAVETDQAKSDLGLKDTGDRLYKPLFDEPVRGNIVNRGELNYVGQEVEFFFQTENGQDAFAIPDVYVKWVVVKNDKPAVHLKDGSTHHREFDTPDYFNYAWKETGIHVVHAFVTHTFYQPAHFQIECEVKTEEARTKELNDEAFKGLQGSARAYDWPFDVSWFNTLFGSKKEEYGKISWDTTPDDFARKSYVDRVRFLGDDKKRLEDMIKAHTKDGTLNSDASDPRWADMVKYATDRLKELGDTQATLDKENKDGNVFFEARATFLSRKNGIPDKQLKLVASSKKDGTTIKTIIHDFTQLYEPTNYTFSQSGTTWDKATEQTFVDMCKSYPPGRVSALFEALDKDLKPNNQTLGFEFDTGTAWKDVKSVAYNEYVQLAVNIVGAAVMVFVPVTAPLMIGLLGAYNSIQTIDNLAELNTKGNLTWTNVATGVAQVGLNFLPYVGEMKPVAQFGKVAMYALDGVTLVSMGAIMTIEAVDQIRKLRNQDISKIAEKDEQIRKLEATNKSDPRLPAMRAELDKMIKDAQDESSKVIDQLAKSGAIMLVQMAGLKALHAKVAAKSAAQMKSEGLFSGGKGEPHYDPQTGTIKGDPAAFAKLSPEALDKLKTAYELDMSGKQAELQNVLGTDKVTIERTKGDKVVVTKDGEDYKVELPSDKPFKDAIDEAWTFRKATDPNAPADKPAPVVADVKPTLEPADLVAKSNIAVGTRVTSEGEAQAILGKLTRGDRSAFKALGMEPPPKTFDTRTVEWGIRQMPDGSFIIIRGESGAVDWSGFKGVRAVAHSHPLTAQTMIRGGGVTFDQLVQGGGANELNKVNVFPSAADVQFCVAHGLGEHVVQTPYVSKSGGRIGNPTPGANEPLVSIKIVQPERVGSWNGNADIGVYKTKMVAVDANGKILWTGEVHTIDHPGIGSLVMFEEPPASLMTKNIAGGPKPTSTPAGGGGTPIPAADHLKVVQSADGHCTRELGQYEVPADAEARVRQAAKDAAEAAYRDAVDTKKLDATKARKAASDAAKKAAKTTAATEAETAAKSKVQEKITSGDVFDTSKMPPDAKQQLENFNLGTSGGEAKRLASQLDGTSLADMQTLLDAEVAAGKASKATQPIPDPTTKGATQDQLVYEFGDGTVIRIKPKGDKFNPGDMMYSVEVKQVPPGSSKPGQAGVAFKVDAQGRPVPKGPDEIKNPYNHGMYPKQNKIFEKTVLDAGHRKAP